MNALPTLVFEPELDDLNDKAKLMELENDLSEPNLLLELLSEEFVSEFDPGLSRLEDAQKNLLSVLAKQHGNSSQTAIQ